MEPTTESSSFCLDRKQAVGSCYLRSRGLAGRRCIPLPPDHTHPGMEAEAGANVVTACPAPQDAPESERRGAPMVPRWFPFVLERASGGAEAPCYGRRLRGKQVSRTSSLLVPVAPY